MGRLHGLPISLKDQFHVQGVETTMGYVGWIGTFEGERGTGKELQFESELVRELRSQGAIVYCKTSVPHTLMTGETINNIIGYTWNPKNRLLSSGGSSGGEGALLALRGSCIGFGTDIGGSVRIPAGFNGLFALKPSSGRVPYEGMANSMDGQTSLLSVVGPMATSPRSLRLLMQSILETQPWLHDPLCVNMPWRSSITQESQKDQKLTFGILEHDGFVSLHPPVQRAIKLVRAAISRLGYSAIDWTPPSHQRGVQFAVRKHPIAFQSDSCTILSAYIYIGLISLSSTMFSSLMVELMFIDPCALLKSLLHLNSTICMVLSPYKRDLLLRLPP